MSEVEEGGEAEGVEVLGVNDGGAGLKGVAADGDGGHAAAYGGAAFEDLDVGEAGGGGGGGAGVVFEEMGEGGTGDTAADDADRGGRGGKGNEGEEVEEDLDVEDEGAPAPLR